MGTLANGIKDIFSTSQTTATHLPVCASDGTPQGRISVVDLASVLGALKDKGVLSNKDLNNYTEDGKYYTTTNITNSPTNEYCFLFVSRHVTNEPNHPYVFQMMQCVNSGDTWLRVQDYGTWKAWHHIPADLPAFYKNYNDLGALADGILGIGKPITVVRAGVGSTDLLTLCKNYYNSMAVDTVAFIHMDATTTSFGFIMKGNMGSGSGVGVIKMIKGATGEVISYFKAYNSDTWVTSTF